MLFKHFDIPYNSKISQTLIDKFFSTNLAFDFKKAFAVTFFANASIENSISHVQLMRLITADINRFMWSKYPEDIVTSDSYESFPLIDEFIIPNVINLLNFSKQHNDLFQKHTHIKAFIPHLKLATSP